MPNLPHVFVNFQNTDPSGQVRLVCVGTTQDLSRQQVQLREGLRLMLYEDDADAEGREGRLVVEGSVTYSQEEQCWAAMIDWDAIRFVPEAPAGTPANSPKNDAALLLGTGDSSVPVPTPPLSH